MRRRFFRKNPAVAVPAIVAINIGVFVAWMVSVQYETLPEFMFKNFLVSWTALEFGRWWTLINAAFSHNMFWHLLLNMYVLLGFGSMVELALGFRRFVLFYLFAGVLSSFSHAYISATVVGAPDLPALGASGAIAGVILLFSLKFPREGILLFGIIPVPAIFGALLFIGLDLWGLWAQAGGGGLPIGHGAHLGGAAAGVIYFMFFELGRSKRRPSYDRGSGQI